MRIAAPSRRSIPERNALVEANLRLAFSFVRRVFPVQANDPDRADDLIQAALMGLMRAAELYDPDRGCAFSTYAETWMNNHVRRELLRHTTGIAHKMAMRGEPPNVRSIEAIQEENRIELADPRTSDPAELLAQAEYKQTIRQALLVLPRKHRAVLYRRAAGQTLDGIGKLFGLTRERVRQIEQDARERLRKLKPELAERLG